MVKIWNLHEISVKRIYLKNNAFEIFFCVVLRIEQLIDFTRAFFNLIFKLIQISKKTRKKLLRKLSLCTRIFLLSKFRWILKIIDIRTIWIDFEKKILEKYSLNRFINEINLLMFVISLN